jgi:hypothetical protein
LCEVHTISQNVLNGLDIRLKARPALYSSGEIFPTGFEAKPPVIVRHLFEVDASASGNNLVSAGLPSSSRPWNLISAEPVSFFQIRSGCSVSAILGSYLGPVTVGVTVTSNKQPNRTFRLFDSGVAWGKAYNTDESRHDMAAKLTPEIIEAAIFGFEQRKRELTASLDAQIGELRALLPENRSQAATSDEAGPVKRKRFSAASRRKMALAQKARWSKIKGESQSSAPAPAEAPKAKHELSKQGRANIVAALKKRWATAKRAGTSATAKNTAPARKKATAKKTTAA